MTREDLSSLRVLVTGADGMVGRALSATLRTLGVRELFAPRRLDLDLRDRGAVLDYWSEVHPDVVFLIAAKVGGIAANMADPVGFLADNVLMATHTFEACRLTSVKKVVYLGSSCVYPRECEQPMRESALLTGPLEPTNEGYALAKIVGLVLARDYRRQYGLSSISLMPCNIYGTGDHFELDRSHVLSALVKRFVDAADEGAPSVTLWGKGTARREFMHVSDLVSAILFLLERYDDERLINVGTGTDVSIRELAQLVAFEAHYAGQIAWDPARPDGMPRKCLDVTVLRQLGFEPRVSLIDGVRQTIAEYRALKRGQQGKHE